MREHLLHDRLFYDVFYIPARVKDTNNRNDTTSFINTIKDTIMIHRHLTYSP